MNYLASECHEVVNGLWKSVWI